MAIIVAEEEEFAGKARIYHRYRISGVRKPGGKDGLTGHREIHEYKQMHLPFDPMEQMTLSAVEQIVTSDSSPGPLDPGLQERLRQYAEREARSLDFSLLPSQFQRLPEFQEYLARYQDRSQTTVVVFGTDIHRPKEVHQFRAFRMKEPESEDVFLFNAPGALVNSFLRELADANPDVEIFHPTLDLQGLSAAGMTQVRGASFSIKGRPNLTTAMVYGPGVNEDDAFDEYSKIGQLTFLQLQLVVQTQEVRMMVTSRGSILPYGLDDIVAELRLATEVYKTYLTPFVKGEAPLVQRRRRR